MLTTLGSPCPTAASGPMACPRPWWAGVMPSFLPSFAEGCGGFGGVAIARGHHSKHLVGLPPVGGIHRAAVRRAQPAWSSVGISDKSKLYPGFCVPSVVPRTAVGPSLSGRSAAQIETGKHGKRSSPVSMKAGFSGGESTSNLDDSFADPVIPDAVGTAAIQERLDLIRRARDIRWASTGTGAGSRTTAAPPEAAVSSAAREGHASVKRATPPRAAWVLMFNNGPRASAKRGLYCLWSNGQNSVVAFEEREGALRYALELKAQGLGLPGPTRVAVKDLRRFCHEHSFGHHIISKDVVPVAPDKTKDELEFDPNAQRREGRGRPTGSGADGASDEASVLTAEDVRKWRDNFERLCSGEKL